jgi:hypothetical protein
LQPKLFVIHPLLPLVGVLIVGLIIFSLVLTSSTAAPAIATVSDMIDTELEDKAIKQELEPSETEEIKDGDEEDDNTAKQEEEGEDEEQESNDDTAGRRLEEDDNIMIDNNYSSYDDVPFDLPLDNPMPFP